MLQLLKPTGGSVRFMGQELTTMGRGDLREMRKEMQIVFQDPYSSLNPRMTVGNIVGEPMLVHGQGTRRAREARVRDLLETVGFNPDFTNRYPHEFSGGQRQRIGIARALALNPRLIVCDEPVSALDVSIQAQILNLLKDLQRDLGLAYLFVAHDLAVVRTMSDNIAVMNKGKLVEIGRAEDVYTNPQEDYTKALLAAVPVPDPRRMRERKRERRKLAHADRRRVLVLRRCAAAGVAHRGVDAGAPQLLRRRAARRRRLRRRRHGRRERHVRAPPRALRPAARHVDARSPTCRPRRAPQPARRSAASSSSSAARRSGA